MTLVHRVNDRHLKVRYRLFATPIAAAILLLLAARTACPQSNNSPLNSRCPLEDALNYHLVQTLVMLGVSEEQFEHLAASGEISRTIGVACLDELNHAATYPDRKCELVNGKMMSQLRPYVLIAAVFFEMSSDGPAFRSNLRAVLRAYLNSTPGTCWFQGVMMPGSDESSSELTITL